MGETSIHRPSPRSGVLPQGNTTGLKREGRMAGSHDANPPPQESLPVSYRIDSAGHKVAYGEPWLVLTKMLGSRVEWCETYGERCWRGE